MEVEDNLLAIANAMFKNRLNWNNVSNTLKEKWFFIFNRYFSKTYPEKAQLLNLKTIDKVTAMELWFQFMKTQPYPDNFWSKSPKKENEGLTDKERKSLRKHLRIDDHDLDYLCRRYPDIIKEELGHLIKLEKQNSK